MARLNTRPSHISSARSSAAPTSNWPSDQENHDPDPQRLKMDKGKGRAVDATPELSRRASLPTPNSDSDGARAGQKRKRDEARASRVESEEDSDEEDEEEREARKLTKYYDPDQDVEQRRKVKKKSRALERDFQENRDELLRDTGTGITNVIQKQNLVFKDVKQTNDATIDSRLLVNVSDLAYKKTAQLVLGDTSTGIDVDEFLSKCLTYMRNSGPIDRDDDEDNAPSSSRRRRTQNRDDSDDEADGDEIGAPLDWALLGQHACYPYNSRPCLPSFLLGPLSVEKEQRTQTQRRSRQAKDTSGRESRPEALSREDLTTSDENGLTAICTRINTHLKRHIQRGQKAIEQAGFSSKAELAETERGKAMLKKHRLNETGAVSLFDFVLNPRSFGQTVENLFYVSFLIKEGALGIASDCHGLPAIEPQAPTTLEHQRKNRTSKHQAVFSLDYSTWQSLVDAFEVSEPLIEHRHEEVATQMGARGWYT